MSIPRNSDLKNAYNSYHDINGSPICSKEISGKAYVPQLPH